MDHQFSVNQFVILANGLKNRFDENPSLFVLTDPPSHSVKVSLSPTICYSFSSRDESVKIESNSIEFEACPPNPLLHPIQWINFFAAKRKLWSMAETMLHSHKNKAEELLYSLFPEMLEKNMNEQGK